MPQRSFNEFKNKAHICAVAYIDRNIQKEKTGRKDIKKQDITVDRIEDEVRKISFRDTENYTVDSKARFEHIVNEVPLDPVAFAEAIKDAIKYAKTNGISKTSTVTSVADDKPVEEEKPKKRTKKTEAEIPVETPANEVKEDFDSLFAVPTEKEYPKDIKDAVAQAFMACKDKTKKQNVMRYTQEVGVAKVPDMNEEQLRAVYDILTE
jgi:hypothetical protein